MIKAQLVFFFLILFILRGSCSALKSNFKEKSLDKMAETSTPIILISSKESDKGTTNSPTVAAVCDNSSYSLCWTLTNNGGCNGGSRTQTYRLYNIVGSWELACANSLLVLNGINYAPVYCYNSWGEYAQFNVPC